jgi:hypothetical protein
LKRLKGKKIIVVCSDPGASQTLPFLIKNLKGNKADVFVIARYSGRYFANERGLNINKNRFAYSNCRAIKRFINQKRPDFIITGTSLRDDLERNYIKASRSLKIPVLSIIDWWTSFRRRFTHSKTKELCIPDWICVVDKVAEKMCREELGNKVNIMVTGNPYFSYISKSGRTSASDKRGVLKKLNLDSDRPTILYLAEPTEPPMGYDQFNIFRHVTQEVSRVAKTYRKKYNFIIKFHPNGEKSHIYRKYERISNVLDNSCNISMVRQQYNIGELIDSADYVWGMNTTPLLEAILRGKLVSSFLHDVDFSGVPFAKKANFCPSADDYRQYGALIRNLLTDNGFVRRAIERQKRYRIPKEDFANKICGILKSELREG